MRNGQQFSGVIECELAVEAFVDIGYFHSLFIDNDARVLGGEHLQCDAESCGRCQGDTPAIVDDDLLASRLGIIGILSFFCDKPVV